MKQMFTCSIFWITFFCCAWPGILPAQTWRPLSPIPAGFSFDTTRGAPVLAVSPTGIPYVLYQDFGPGGGPGNTFVMAYMDSAWVSVGNQSFARSKLGGADIHYAPHDSVYTGLNDGGALPEVYGTSGATWSQIGMPDSPANTTTVPLSLAIDRNGTPWYVIYNVRTGNPSVYTYSGGAWVEVGAGQLGNNTSGTAIQLAFDYTNTPYVAYEEAGPAGSPYLLVERYNAGSWTQLGNALLSTGSNHVLSFDDQNTPYAIDNIDSTTDSLYYQLMRFSGGNWLPAGPLIVHSASGSNSTLVSVYGITQLYLAMGSHNTPLVASYQNTTPYPAIEVVKLNNNQWVPLADTTINPQAASSNAIGFTADTLGHAFIAYTGIFPQTVSVFRFVQTNPKPVITFNPIDTTYGTPDFAPGATSTNTDPGDPIVYTIADTTVATIAGGKVHILNRGSTTITATQAADNNWSAADPVTVRLTIFPDSQYITFPGWPQKKVGDPDFPAGATVSSGLPMTYESSDPTIATISPAGIIHIIEQGAVIMTVRQPGNNNYLPAPDVAQVLIITAADSTDSTGNSPGHGKGKLNAWCNSPSGLLAQVEAPVEGPAKLELFNSFGWRIYSREIELSTKGNNTFLLPVSGMPGGIYYVRVAGSSYNLIRSVWLR